MQRLAEITALEEENKKLSIALAQAEARKHKGSHSQTHADDHNMHSLALQAETVTALRSQLNVMTQEKMRLTQRVTSLIKAAEVVEERCAEGEKERVLLVVGTEQLRRKLRKCTELLESKQK